MRVEEAAKKVGLGKKTIYALCEAQQLAHIHIGKVGSKRPRIYIQESDLRKALKHLRTEANPLLQFSDVDLDD
jgi:excisionase family DNA binding protein